MTTIEGSDLQDLLAGAARDAITRLVVDTGGRVLIVRRAADDVFLAGVEEPPSGGVEPGEILLSATARAHRRDRLGRPARSRPPWFRHLFRRHRPAGHAR
ncbi:NUDIX domain-containing protein [Bailinhaonella thermotolerans]|uniref:NUDIX domain-containing protein n=1 Tax=Bailinhaonella thermotolerans TaxID=1070861 RepID=UPI0011C37B78|nr:NUDIX domain-containing protein [Bailinhaonella thermotolerans]